MVTDSKGVSKPAVKRFKVQGYHEGFWEMERFNTVLMLTLSLPDRPEALTSRLILRHLLLAC